MARPVRSPWRKGGGGGWAEPPPSGIHLVRLPTEWPHFSTCSQTARKTARRTKTDRQTDRSAATREKSCFFLYRNTATHEDKQGETEHRKTTEEKTGEG